MASELGSALSHAPTSSLSWVLTPSCPFLFSHLILFVSLPLFCGPAYLPPRNCLCMTVAVTGSKCLYVCVCMCVCMHVYVCARVLTRFGNQTCAALHPWARPERVVCFLGVELCVRMRWEAAPTPGLSPGQGLTKQRAGDVFVFNCGIWGVFAWSPFPTPLFPYIPLQQQLGFPLSSPHSTFLPFSFNQNFPPPKAKLRYINSFFFLLFVFCLWTHISLGNVSSLPLHVCLNSHWLSTPSLSKNDVFPSRTPSGLPSQSGGGGRRASALVRPRARLHQARKAQPSFIQTVPNPAPLPGNLKARLVPQACLNCSFFCV